MTGEEIKQYCKRVAKEAVSYAKDCIETRSDYDDDLTLIECAYMDGYNAGYRANQMKLIYLTHYENLSPITLNPAAIAYVKPDSSDPMCTEIGLLTTEGTENKILAWGSADTITELWRNSL